jgi:hypothetical protein
MPTIKETEKSDWGRLYSIAIVAPALVYFATRKQLSSGERRWLAVAGASLLITVGLAYLDNERKLKEHEQRTS